MMELVQLLINTLGHNWGAIAAVAASTAIIVWKVAQYANRIINTLQQQGYTIKIQGEKISDLEADNLVLHQKTEHLTIKVAKLEAVK